MDNMPFNFDMFEIHMVMINGKTTRWRILYHPSTLDKWSTRPVDISSLVSLHFRHSGLVGPDPPWQ
jgi:hypothetical protein